mgnify:FL=1
MTLIYILRGGSWLNRRNHAQCSYRRWYLPDYRWNSFIGVRLSLDPSRAQKGMTDVHTIP